MDNNTKVMTSDAGGVERTKSRPDSSGSLCAAVGVEARWQTECDTSAIPPSASHSQGGE